MENQTYQISWQDRLLLFLARFPGPAIIADLVFVALFYLLWNASNWLFGVKPFGYFDPELANSVFWLLVSFVLGRYLRFSARIAIDEFRPALPVSETEFANLRQRFLNMSKRSGYWLTLAGGLISVALVLETTPTNNADLGAWLAVFTNFALSLLMYTMVTSAFWYVVYQVLSVPGLYKRVADINSFNLGPLTAFSGLTLRIALPFILLGGLSYVPGEPLAIVFMVIDLLIACFAFIVPLWGMHIRLVEEKNRLKAENGQLLKATYSQLHQMAVDGNHERVSDLRTTVASLMEFRAFIATISTWPWDTSTIRTFLSAFMLPIALWFIQGFLSQFVSF